MSRIETDTPLKIALVGTSCVGKTTIFKHFQALYSGDTRVGFVPEAARDVFEAHPTDAPFSYPNQRKVQTEAMKRERAANKPGVKIVLTDRSVFDAPVYLWATDNQKGGARLWIRAQEYEEKHAYDHIFVPVPEGVPYMLDDIRRESPERRARFHESFINTFRLRRMPFMTLTGSLQDRIDFVDEIIQQGLDDTYDPIDPNLLSCERREIYRKQRGEIAHPDGNRTVDQVYKGYRPLLAFIRECRVGIGTILRAPNYGWGEDPHYAVGKQGLMRTADQTLHKPQVVLNLETAPDGWNIVTLP